MRSIIFAAALVALSPLAAQAQDAPAGNAENGQRLFNQCRACHTANEGGRNGVGPNLYRVYGRAAGSIEGFRYSAPMRAKAGEGLVWNEANLRAYLADPKAVVPAGSMSFQGFRDNAQNISDVIAYLRQVGGQ
ncbi:cytochrome c family protein [Roseococcus sp. SDR]|uniref:c-type cytochrome n=1 Tax=Roseococcus sp. SDR TaxID=2835532 RepID=UPI001BCB6296|nr:cytochrome c family protein [Roseococcus sp. SDR]MBS7793044.1 cytochrome c family protein [Roseococcus sp. SDR]MBV1848358.1 cytochrome c family protein [Roseococcus sp. SDR]